MEKPLTITAVCGWALPPDWFRERIAKAFPGAQVRVLYPAYPAESGEAKDLLDSSPADLFIGYSLGSLWLLFHREILPKSAQKALLAPILGFSREQGMGGKTSATQLRYLIRAMKRNPDDVTPLMNFYAGCGMPLPEPFLQKVPNCEILIRGLEFLEQVSVPAESARDFLAVLGKNDEFSDSGEMKRLIPQVDVVDDAGHSPETLLRRLAEMI